MIHGCPAGVTSELSVDARAIGVAALVFLFHGPDGRTDLLWLRHPECRQGSDLADKRGRHGARSAGAGRARVTIEPEATR